MKTIAIAGGSGYTGVRLLPLLSDAKLKILLRPGTAEKSPWAERDDVAPCDLMNPESLEPKLTDVDEIICLVGTTRKQFREGISYETVDWGIPKALAEAGHRAGVKKMHLLTSVGAGNPTGSYLAYKQRAENSLRDSGLIWTIVRPSGIVGPGRPWFRFADPFLKIATHIPGLSKNAWRFHSLEADRLAAIFATLTRTDEYDKRILEGEILQKMPLLEAGK